MGVEDNVLSLIGGTPLIRLKKVVKGFNGNFFTKFEAFNPGHSNKDRIALHIIKEENKGILNQEILSLRPLLATLGLA